MAVTAADFTHWPFHTRRSRFRAAAHGGLHNADPQFPGSGHKHEPHKPRGGNVVDPGL